MVFSSEDRILIEQLHHSKGYGARKLVKEFPEKGWNVCSVGRLLKKLKYIGTTCRQAGSGRPRTARTPENIDVVGDMICRQEDAPSTHRTVRQISREMGIRKSSVVRIIHNDLQLKCLKKKRAQELTASIRLNRVQRSQLLLSMKSGSFFSPMRNCSL